MPFRQPTITLIKSYQFLAATYTFPIEAVMLAESGGGQLRIDVTDGYLLRTPSNESLQPYQTLDYLSQPDGSWLVSTTATLVVTASSLLSGTISMQTPIGEVLRMAISIEPTLYINDAPLWFDDTEPGQTAATVLAIRQQGAITPIHLQIDPANTFTVADAKMAFLTSTGLYLVPPFEGAHVIVSYTPNQPGHHHARLVVTTPYVTKTIQVRGQTGGLLSWIPRLYIPTPKIYSLVRQLNVILPTLRRNFVVGAIIFILGCSLVWMNHILLVASTSRVNITVLAKPAATPVRQSAASVSTAHEKAPQSPQTELATRDDNDVLSQQPPMTLPDQRTERVVARQISPADRATSTGAIHDSLSRLDQRELIDPSRAVTAVPPTPKPRRLIKANRTAPATIESTAQRQLSVIDPTNQVSDLEKELNGVVYPRHRSTP